MLIDWFTVAAQILNFLILVWLLKRFLYKPILQAIDDREKRIATELADADAVKTEAQKEREEFQHKNKEFDRQRSALMRKTQEEVSAEGQRLLTEARQKAETLQTKRLEDLQREQQDLNDEISRRTRQEIFAIAGKALTDLAGVSLEERLCEVFADRLRKLDDEARKGLSRSLKIAADPVLVRSAFELSPAQQTRIRQALDETFPAEPAAPAGSKIEVRFESAPELISGIELTSHGQKVTWSIAAYLEALEKEVAELLGKKAAPEAEAAPEPATTKSAKKSQ